MAVLSAESQAKRERGVKHADNKRESKRQKLKRRVDQMKWNQRRAELPESLKANLKAKMEGASEMRYFENKQIHSCMASFSSNDVFVTREIERDEFLLHHGEKTVSRKHGFSVAYAEADKRFYAGFLGDRVAATELQAYIEATYLSRGWVMDHPFLKPAQEAQWKDDEIADQQRREREGYVIPEWSKDVPPDAYQGGFSGDVFFNPSLYNYVKGGGCHGFIGHSVRKPKLDAYLERKFLKVDADKSLFAMWLTSTGGRHFGDSLEGAAFAVQRAYIRKNVAGLVEQAKGYRNKERVA